MVLIFALFDYDIGKDFLRLKNFWYLDKGEKLHNADYKLIEDCVKYLFLFCQGALLMWTSTKITMFIECFFLLKHINWLDMQQVHYHYEIRKQKRYLCRRTAFFKEVLSIELKTQENYFVKFQILFF